MEGEGKVDAEARQWITLYPCYINSQRKRPEGRRIGAGDACKSPLLRSATVVARAAIAIARPGCAVYVEAHAGFAEVLWRVRVGGGSVVSRALHGGSSRRVQARTRRCARCARCASTTRSLWCHRYAAAVLSRRGVVTVLTDVWCVAWAAPEAAPTGLASTRKVEGAASDGRRGVRTRHHPHKCVHGVPCAVQAPLPCS